MPDMEQKSIVLEVKTDDETPGLVTAEFAAFDEVDRDGEITKKGAFGNQEVLLGAYGHASLGSFGGNASPPIGRGKISEESGVAVFKGQFNLEMLSGKETYESVKMSGGLQQWSYGFRVTKESSTMVQGTPRRVLEKLAVSEVSPVIVGAGNNTNTRDIKSASDMTLESHTDAALSTWQEYIERIKALAALRSKDGRVLSAANRTRLANLATSLRELDAELACLLAESEPPEKSAAMAAFMAYQKTLSRIHGVNVGGQYA